MWTSFGIWRRFVGVFPSRTSGPHDMKARAMLIRNPGPAANLSKHYPWPWPRGLFFSSSLSTSNCKVSPKVGVPRFRFAIKSPRGKGRQTPWIFFFSVRVYLRIVYSKLLYSMVFDNEHIYVFIAFLSPGGLAYRGGTKFTLCAAFVSVSLPALITMRGEPGHCCAGNYRYK
jgi:hypothetical protein